PVTVKVGSSLEFTASGSDPDAYAGEPLAFTLDADAPTNAVIDEISGAFLWTPDATFAGTTNTFNVSVQDAPTNGANAKITGQDITVAVIADTVGVQSLDGGG